MQKKNLFMILGLMAVLCACNSDPMTVKTTKGKVLGVEEEGTIAFKGIPYAKIERFMPPQEAEPWDTVMVCDKYGPYAMQAGGFPGAVMSEENTCTLNVWTKDTKAKMPVMLWIHGGGYATGHSSWNPGYGLARKDVVFVSINHRLNILGYMDLSSFGEKYKYSGNVGELDIVAALEWIRDNIKRFGGDPDNVTIMGHSGGGGKVGSIMCMPSAKGLFHKAIIYSGVIVGSNTTATSSKLGEAVAKELGLTAETIDKIQTVPYDELNAAGQRATAGLRGIAGGFAPTMDGEVIVTQPFKPAFADFSKNIPVIIGTTLNEFGVNYYGKDMTLDEARKILAPTFGEDTDAFIQAYWEAYPDGSLQDMLSLDRTFRYNSVVSCRGINDQGGAPVWNYLFTWQKPTDHYSAHGDELPFFFNTIEAEKRKVPEITPAVANLEDVMSDYWVNFAYTGNPNGEGLPAWHSFGEANEPCMIFDEKVEEREAFDAKMQELIRKHLTR
ncbi:MAG: carboxylesterase/lipase family protein [Bacteroidales bacterium]|jgi:para-nitrobenzyl esterase|nr:carboxylesterase/lipase family protein [Bacteroidales bacterium]